MTLWNLLFKHSAFKEEEECRIIKVTNLSDKSIKNELNADGQTFTYIEYPADLKESLANIYRSSFREIFDLF